MSKMPVPSNSEPTPAVAETYPEAEERVPRLSLWGTLVYCVANLGFGMFYSFNNASLSLYLQKFTSNEVLMNLMGSSHSFEGAIIQPLVGNASDRLRTRWGRRRPFMLIFTPLSVLFLVAAPLTAKLPPTLQLPLLVLCIFLFTVFFNVSQDPYQALMPDITRKEQRGRVTGVWMFVGVVGQAALVMLPLPVEQKFFLVGAVMLVTVLVTCLGTREPEHPPLPESLPLLETEGLPHQGIRDTLRGLLTLLQARKAIVALFFSGFGIGAVLPSLTRFVQKITLCSDHQAEQMFLVLMAATALGVLPCGWLTDRIGPKRMLLVGQGLIALAAINGLWVTTLWQIAVVLAIAGLGNAAQSASAYPLLTRLVPGEEVGFYTGLQTTALSIAAPLTSILTGLLVHQGGYRYIFVVCSVSVAIALFFLSRIDVDAAKTEVARRDREQGR